MSQENRKVAKDMITDGKRLNNITYKLKKSESKRENLDISDALNILENLLISGEFYWLIENHIKQSDELESLHAAYNDAQKEISTLNRQNKRLIKRSNKLGQDLLWAKNKLRENGIEEWKLLNKANRNA